MTNLRPSYIYMQASALEDTLYYIVVDILDHQFNQGANAS